MYSPEAEFLDKIQTKVLRVFLYSFAFKFLFLQIHATSYSFCKEERRITDRKPYPLPYGLRNPYRNLKSENSHDYAQKPKRNCTFMNSASDLPTFKNEYGIQFLQMDLCFLIFNEVNKVNIGKVN